MRAASVPLAATRAALEVQCQREHAPAESLASCKTLANPLQPAPQNRARGSKQRPRHLAQSQHHWFLLLHRSNNYAKRPKNHIAGCSANCSCSTAPALSNEALKATAQSRHRRKQHGSPPSSYPPAARGRGPRHGCGASEAKIKGARLGDGCVGRPRGGGRRGLRGARVPAWKSTSASGALSDDANAP